MILFYEGDVGSHNEIRMSFLETDILATGAFTMASFQKLLGVSQGAMTSTDASSLQSSGN